MRSKAVLPTKTGVEPSCLKNYQKASPEQMQRGGEAWQQHSLRQMTPSVHLCFVLSPVQSRHHYTAEMVRDDADHKKPPLQAIVAPARSSRRITFIIPQKTAH